MLKKLASRKTAKKVWIILAILIVPAFVLWGFGGAFKSRQESQYAGKIFDKKISLLEYRDAFEAVKNQAIMQFGENFSEIQKYLNLESQAWDRLLLLYEAKIRKTNASDREVIELIESYPFFQRKGQFNNRIYSETLQYVFRTQPRVFEEETRQNIIISKLYKEITEGAVTLNEAEIQEEYRKANAEISVSYIAGIPADFIKEISLSEEELKDYFTKNALEFKQPLSFNIEYIALDSEEKIKSILPHLNKKDGFTKIAKEPGISVKETGLISQTDPIPGIGWSVQIASLVSKLKVDEFSPPIHIDKYYYILRLKTRKEPFIPDYDSIKDKVRQAFLNKQSQGTAKEKIEACLKKLKETPLKSVDFEKIAKGFGLKSGSTQNFKYGSYIEGIGASDKFWLAAQNLREDEISGIIEMEPAGFYILKVKSHIPMDNNKFETEKKEFSQRILLQKKQEYFAQFIEELRRKAQAF